jgi:ADP-heptose:LPS heptosyltransferase
VALSRPLLLLYRPLGLGDFLTGLPAIRGLARAFPEHRLALAAPAPLQPLARLAGGGLEMLPTGPLEVPACRRPAVAANLHGRGPQSHRAVLATGPRRLLAFAHPDVPETAGFPRWRAEEHETRRWCRMLAAFGVVADPADLDLPRPRRRPPGAAIGATMLHPGAASPARRWPVSRWAAVARAETAAGRRVVVSAGPGEESLAGAVLAGAGLPPDSLLAGLDLEALAAAVAAADRVVCGDTGLAHLAAALGRPSVLLYGPTPPELWGPPRSPRHVVLWAGGEPADPHADRPDARLLRISPDEVVAALSRLPQAPAA